MLTLLGRKIRHCDRLSRRDFLAAGTLVAGGLTLAELLRLEAAAGVGSSRKAVIQIHLDGGPPQMDMIDPKPQAPVEIRGEFRPIPTRLAGLQICELMPQLAAAAQDFVFIRSLVGAEGQHDAFQCQSGFAARDLESLGGRPAMGSVVAYLRGQPGDVAPPFVDLMQGRPLVRNSGRPGFLGPAYSPFRPDMSRWFDRQLEDGMKVELANLGNHHTTELTLHTSLQAGRLQSRQALLGQLDRVRRQIDASGMMTAMDRFQQQAAGILTSGQFAEALDWTRENRHTIARYTPQPTGVPPSATSESEHAMRKLLLARRLVEAGVRCVSVSFSDFDTHSQNFQRMRHLLPVLDHGLCALIGDLKERGMLDDVAVVAWGEFGRTPKVNQNAGRDHWPRVAPALLAGGGLRSGQVIGATDRLAGEAVARPVHYQDVLATLYHHLGINARATTIQDPSGRPQYLLDRGQPISELV